MSAILGERPGRNGAGELVAQVAISFNKRTYRFECAESDAERLAQIAGYLKDKLDLLREGDEIQLKKAGEEIISIELSDFVELKVVQTPPGFKGDTVQATFKPARLETGAVVQVPLFINEGDTIRVSTRTGEYVTRVS